MVDTTIRIGLEVDGSQAIKEFENVTTATEGIIANMKKIRSESDSMMPDSDSFYNQSEASVRNSFSRIDAINKQIDNTPIFSEHQLENLYAEREMLRRGIEATVKEMQQFASSSTEFIHSFSSKKGGTSSLQAVTKMMPSLMNIVRQVADFQRESDTLMDTAAFKAGIKNKIAEAGLISQLGFAKDSKSMDKLAEYLMLKGTDQTQRKSFMSQIASGYEKKQHLYDNFSAMLPDKFKDFHAAKGTLAAPEDSTQITTRERRQISELLKTNPYFMQAAEAAGIGRRMNGTIEMRSGITRGMVNRLAGNLYGTIISSAKGMPMYGITDVDDPQYWDRIARKSNKPFLGSMNSARALSDNFAWLKPSIGGTYKGDPTATYTPLIDEKGKPVAVPFSPNIKRYEVANYTLDDLKKNVDLNKDRSQMYEQTTGRKDTYIPIDHSARLENIFRHRKSGIMPGNNDAVDDLLFLQLDKRFGDPNLDEATRESLMKEYASYIDKGITKTVNGKSTHFSFTRAHKGLGLEFVQDAIFDAMAPVDPNTGERDLSAFWGGVKLPKVSVKDKHLKGGKMVNYTPEEVSNLAAKFVEYASKDATSGESIESLYGTVLPDNLKIGIFDLEDAAKKASSDQAIAGAGMNGTSYISKKLVPGGFQARMPGIKTALNSVDFGGFLSHFGGAIKTIGPDGRIEDITPDLDLLLSMSDIKNAGIRYQDENGNLLPTQEIVKNIRQEIKNNGGKIFANKTMDDAQSGIHWMSRQFSQILGDDPEFVQMTTKAFLDEYEKVGTLEGALDTVFAGDSEMRDLILSTRGAIMSDRKIQDRIQDFRNGMISRISQGDTILPRELETSRAMAQPWFFNAAISGMKRINAAGTGLAKEGEKTYFDALLEDPSRMTKEQKEILDNITMDNDDVAYQKIMAEVLGIGRYPATSRSARQAYNVLADGSKKAQMMRSALEKSGFDPNAFYISPSSPLMQLLQDADFDGDVMDLVGLAYSGQDKNGEKLNVAKVFQRVYERGMEKIDKMGLSQEETDARKEQFSKAVFKMDSFDARNGMDVMKTIVPAMQGGYFMGGPDATIRNAMQIPWTESVRRAIADAESQYSVNSVRNKQGVEMATTPEQMELLSKYRTFTEFFHAVNKNRDEFGNVDIPALTEAMRGSDGLSGAKFWATNLPFHTMSPNVRTMMLSRYFAKQRGIDINEGYDWNYIFDSVLGKKDESTALGRMQSGLRDAWMGYLNADYLAMNEESVAKLGELRKLAIDEEAARVKEERGRQGSSSYGKKGSNRSIAERLVDRLGGNVIKNAVAGMAMTESHLEDEGANSGMFQFLKDANMPNVVGGINLDELLAQKTTPKTFEEMSATTKSTQLARTLDMFNLLTLREKQNRIDNMPRLSFSTLAKLAYHPEEFMRDIFTGAENNSSLPATEIGQGAHTAIEHFMRARMSGAFYKKDGTVDEEGLKKAQQEALDVFDQYLGVKKAPAGFEREGRGLTDAERTDMLTPGHNLNERYERLKSFLSGDGLLKVFPEKDWEVIGIESSNVGSGEHTGAKNPHMKIPGKGKKILSPDKDVEMTGSYDLLFKNRKDGRVVMGDIKNYWDPKAEDWEKWKVQQSIYASQLKKNGFEDIGASIIEPYFNRQRNIGLTDYDLMQSDENVAKAVKAIQGLAKNGDTTIKDVYDASRFVRQTLFGEVSSSVGDQIADRYSKYTRGGKRGGGTSINPGVITDALWMHDQYKEAIENDEDIHKFINKETRSRDSVYTSDMAWRSKYMQAESLHEAAVQHEKAGRTAEAKDLDARYESAIRDLDNNMGVALVNHITDFAEDVRTSIDGQSGTKQVQDTIKAFKNTQNQQTGFEKSIELFKDRIKETKGRENALTESIKQLEESDKSIAKDEDVYGKLIQYTKEALGLTDDTKGISSRSAGAKRAARTKLLNANAHIRDNSLFAPIAQLFANGNEEGALELLEKRKSELETTRKDTQGEKKKKEAEREGERFQGALMNDQLLQAEKKLNEAAPVMGVYLNQLKKSATGALDDSFISLAGVTDKNVRKPFTTSKARADYINMVGNSLADASSLFEAGMISEADFARYKAQADTLMQEDNLSKVEQAAIDEAKQRLGMKGETPNEQREKWLKDRQQVLEAERDLKKRDARRESINAYKEAKKTNPHIRLRDYKDEYQSAAAEIDQQYEQDLARTEEERKELEAQNELARQQKLERLAYQNEVAKEQRERLYKQQLRARWGQPRSRFAAAFIQQDNMRLGLIQTAKENEFAAKQANERLTGYKDAFAAKYNMSYEDYQNLSKEEKGNIAGDHIKDAQNIAEITQELTKYEEAAKDARDQSKQFTPVMMGMSAGFQTVSQTVGMFLSRFGRQTFYKILNEAKQFVQQFDKSMTEIQMITLKSDSQMTTIGDGLINKAKELKISIKDISQSAATLYRQGLSDEEVNERLDVISKFSKVSGTNVSDATKLITVAMNTGLVTDPEEAADIVTALGDNAATNAAQIEKGIEKAGAAAAADGTTFGQLAAMLTAITSTTQIGGNVAGRTLNTIIGRMNKIGTNEIIYDENGHAISGSAVSKLLKAQGVNTYDEKGNKRSTFDVLYDLSEKWDSISDAEQQQLATAIAGTRQYSNFAAIMQGMKEGKIDEYMNLIGSSSGITDQKYEVYVDSLEASLTNLKNTFDSLVEDLTDTGTLSGALDFFSSMIRGVDNLTKSMGGLGATLTTIVPVLAGVALLKASLMTGQSHLAVIGAIAAGAGLGITYLAGLSDGKTKSQKDKEEYEESKQNAEQEYNQIDSKIRRAEALSKKDRAERTEEENKELEDLKKDLSVFATMSSVASGSIGSLEELQAAIANLGTSAQNTSSAIKQLDDLNNQQKANDIRRNTVKQSASLYGTYGDAYKTYNSAMHGTNSLFYNSLWRKNENGEYELISDFNTFKNTRNSVNANVYDNFPLGNVLVDLVYGKDHLTTWNKDYAPILAETLSQVSSSFGEDVPEGFHNQDVEFWKQRLKSEGMAGYIPDSVWDYVIQYLNAEDAYDIDGFNYQKNELKSGIAQSLIGSVPDEMIPYVAEQMVNNLYDQMYKDGKYTPMSEAMINKELQNLYGFDITNPSSYSYESMDKAVRRYAEAGGYGKEKRDELDAYGLEEGDYYIRENGKTISYEQAKQIREDEKETAEFNQKQYVVKPTDNPNRILSSYGFADYGSSEAAKAAAEANRTWFSYTDQEGQKHYFKTKEQAEHFLSQYEKNQAQWTYAYTNDQGVVQQTGTRKELRGFRQQYNDELNNIYKVSTTDRFGNTELLGTYADIVEASKATSRYNKLVREQFDEELKAAKEAQAESTIASYRDVFGNERIFTGKNARANASRTRNRELRDNQYILTDEYWQPTGQGYETREQAEQGALDNTRYYVGTEMVGVGAEGKAEQERQMAFYSSNENRRHMINGIDVGSYENAQAILNSPQAYVAMDYTGKAVNYYSSWDELIEGEKHAPVNDQYLQELGDRAFTSKYGINARYKKSESGKYSIESVELPGYGFVNVNENGQVVDDNGIVIEGKGPNDIIDENGYINAVRQPIVRSYTRSYSPVGGATNQEYNTLQYTSAQLAPTPEAKAIAPRVLSAEELGLYTDIEISKDDLRLPEMPTFAEITKGFISSLDEELLGGAIEVIEEATEVFEDANAKMKKSKKENLKAVTNHFMAGVESSSQTWATNNETQVAADNMLQIYQDVMAQTEGLSEIERIQALYGYVNENDLAEWSLLTRNSPEFGRALSGIKDDGAGHVVYAAEGSLNEIEQQLFSMSSLGQKQSSLAERGRLALNALDNSKFIGRDANGNLRRDAEGYTWYANRNAAEFEYKRYAEERRKDREKLLNEAKKDYEADLADLNAGRIDENGEIDLNREKRYSRELKKLNSEYRKRVERINRDNDILTEDELAQKEKRLAEAKDRFESDKEELNLSYAGRIDENGKIDINKEKEYSRKLKDLSDKYDKEISIIEEEFGGVLSEDQYYRQNKIKYLQSSDLQALNSIVGAEYVQNLQSGNTTGIETSWAYIRAQNAANGIDGLTNDQKLRLSSELFQTIKNGQLVEKGYSAELNQTARQDIMSGISGLDELYNAAIMLENAEGMTLKLSDIYSTDEQVQNRVKSVLGETYDIERLKDIYRNAEQISALSSYSNTPYYQELVSLYGGLTSEKQTERISTVQSAMSNQERLGRARTALNRLDTSKTFEELDDAVVTELASATNYTKEQIKKMWKKDRAGAKATLESSINAQTEELYQAYEAFWESYAAGFTDQLTFSPDVNLTTDELVSLLESIEGFDESVIAWVRSVRMSVKNGKKVFEEGSEEINSSLKDLQEEENQKGQTRLQRLSGFEEILDGNYLTERARRKAIIQWYEQEAEGTEELAGTSFGYLVSQYAKPNSNVTTQDLEKAYEAEVLGRGNVLDKNSYYIRELFGSEDMTEWDPVKAKARYQQIKKTDSALAQQIDNMLEEVGAGTSFLSGGTGSWNDVLKSFAYQQYLSSPELAGMSDEVRESSAKSMATLRYGTGTERNRLFGTTYENMIKFIKAKRASEDLNNPVNQQIFADAIDGIDYDYVKEKVANNQQDDLIKQLEDQYQQLLTDPIIQLVSLLADVDLNDYSDIESLIAALEEAASGLQGEVGELVTSFIDGLTTASSIANKANTDLQQVYNNARDQYEDPGYRATERGYQALSTNVTVKDGETYQQAFMNRASERDNIDWTKFADFNLLKALLDNYGNGVTESTLDEFILAGRTGEKDVGYRTAMGQAVLGSWISDSGQFIAPKTEEERALLLSEIQAIRSSETGQQEIFDEWVNSTEGAAEVINELENSSVPLERLNQAIERMNTNTSDKQTNNLKKYGNAAQDSLDKLSQYTADMTRLSNQTSRFNSIISKINSGKIKTGKDLSKEERAALLERTKGLDEKDLKKMGANAIKKLAEGAKSASATEWDQMADSIMLDFATELDAAAKDMTMDEQAEIEIKLKTAVNADGSIDVSKLAAIAEELKLQCAAALQQYAGSGGTLSADIDVGALTISWLLNYAESGSFTGSPGSGSPSGKGGGGGGGGKSDVQKLIEKLKHETTASEHYVKMAQAKEEKYANSNEYADYLKAINEEISAQNNLKQVYINNIRQLEDKMKALKEYTDDWWAAKEALDSYRESLANIDNDITEAEGKRITVYEEKFEEQDKTGEHKRTMLQTYAEKYELTDRFADYEKVAQEDIAEIQATIDLNNKQIEEWYKLLDNYEAGTDNWISVRDKIWEIQEENASLEKESIEKTIELNEKRLSQIANAYNYNSSYGQHNYSIAETWASAYETGGYRSEYEQMLQSQISSNASMRNYATQALDEIKTRMEELEAAGLSGTSKWFEARAALFEYEEALASLDADDFTKKQALIESSLGSISEKYSDVADEIKHTNDQLSKFAQNALENNDYDAYFAAMDEYLKNLPKQIEAAKTRLQDLQSIYTKGMAEGTLSPSEQRDILDNIRDAESSILDLEIDQDTKQRQYTKTKIDQFVEDQEWDKSNYEHNQKLLGYKTSIYQNNGELTNYGLMLQEDTNLRKNRITVLQKERKELDLLLSQTKSGSEEEERVTDLIRKNEEAIESENAQINKNTKLLEENEKKIRQVRKTLEDSVNKEIENQKKLEREILSSNVSMQNTILELLKKRLQDEWNLKKKDLNKERENLNEYKKLINERFNYRKKASQQADKDEELADYRRQLALVEADPTRSREAKELRKKIEDLEKEQAWTIAEDQVEAENNRVDDQLEAIDKFVSYNEEKLGEILSDANNFAQELNDILSGSYEESYDKIIAFMQVENEAFMKSLPAAQAKMIQGWEDTWKKAKDVFDNNYAEISEVTKSKNTYLDYMKTNDREYVGLSDEYKKAQASNNTALMDSLSNRMKVIEQQWIDNYDNWTKASKNDAVFVEDNHSLGDVESAIETLKDETFKVKIVDMISPIDVSGAPSIPEFSPKELDTTFVDQSTGKPEKVDTTLATPEQSDIASGWTKDAQGYWYYGEKGKYIKDDWRQIDGSWYAFDAEGRMRTGWFQDPKYNNSWFYLNPEKGSDEGKMFTGTQYISEEDKWAKFDDSGVWIEYTSKPSTNKKTKKKTQEKTETSDDKDKNNLLNKVLSSIPANAEGGLVDYTGLAWVDGTKARPESFLDATDTSLLRSMLDMFNEVKTTPFMSYIDPSMYSNNTNIGDVNITINQAELKSDADFDDVARRVGQAFTKELQRNGLNLSGYSFG